MKVLFIYSIQKSVTFRKPLAGQEGMQFGISYISSVLKHNNHSTNLVVVDRKYGRRTFKALTHAINTFTPDLICFTSVHSEFKFISNLAGYVKKEFPGIPLMAGGVHVTLNPSEEFLEIFDCICIGEGEYPVLEYMECLGEGRSASRIQNLWMKEKGTIYKNAVRNFIQDLDTLSFPDRDIWQKWILEPQTRLTVLLGRGCPYNCTYCSNHKLKNIAGGEYVRLRSPENILMEIEMLHENFPDVSEYFLEVETIGCNMDWLVDLCGKLQAFNISIGNKLHFGTNLRIFPNMDFETVFRNLKLANFDSVIIGLESGNERLRKEILNRFYTNDDLLQAVKVARKYEIKIGIFNMLGIPTETLIDFKDTIRMNQIIKPDWHSTSIFFPYQGTSLYDLTNEMGLLPKKLNTKSERQKAVLNLPGFTASQIQRSFDSFHYEVYKGNENKKVLKLILYFTMKYIGHNSFANLKLKLIRILYYLRLYNLARHFKLFGVFQKA